MNKLEESEVVLTPSVQPTGRSWWWQGAVLLVLVGILYTGILEKLVKQWSDDPNFSHGFIVPLFSAYVIWHQRKVLAAVPLKPSWWGLLVVGLSMMMLVVGTMGAELFLSRSSLLFLLAGVVICHLGWAYFRALIFPWAVLFLMIPIPAIIMNQVTLPLQFLASNLASSLLALLGVPVLQNGNVIQLSNMSLEVVEACSGIRSLTSLVTLAIMYGYLLERRVTIRVLLAIAAVPIAVLTNGLRIMGTGLTGLYWDPDKAQGFFHEFSGWVIFILSMIVLFLVHAALRRIWPDRLTQVN